LPSTAERTHKQHMQECQVEVMGQYGPMQSLTKPSFLM
jgi:hypothetical protein